MYKICLIVPYFGKLPVFFEAWYLTAVKNVDMDFYIITDDRSNKVLQNNASHNVIVKYMEFSECRDIIQSKFDFEISLKSPYKLCDFKPTYGYVFDDIVEGYDYWGYCDIDLLLGNVRKFITDDILSEYDRVFNLGHLCIYRNNPKINEVFKYPGHYPDLDYKEVYTTDAPCYFDEYRGMYAKCILSGVKVYDPIDKRSDPYYKMFKFFDRNITEYSYIIRWHDNELWAIDKKNNKHELIYAHFYRRQFDVDVAIDLEQEENTHALAVYVVVYPNKVMITKEIFDVYDLCKDKKIYKYSMMVKDIKRYKLGFIEYFKRKRWSKDSDAYNKSLTE